MTNAFFVGEKNSDVRKTLGKFTLDNWQSSNIQNLEKNNEKSLKESHIRPYGNWFDYYFGNIKITFLCYWSIFSIDKRDIIQHPIGRYIILANQLNTSSNPEIGHYIERSWCAIFHPMKYTKQVIRHHHT